MSTLGERMSDVGEEPLEMLGWQEPEDVELSPEEEAQVEEELDE